MKNLSNTQPGRIYVRAPQWLGDAVVATVFIKRLRARYPQSRITVGCMPSLAGLFKVSSANDVVALPYPKATAFQAAKLLKERKFDLAFVLPRSFRAAFETWLAGIPIRIGYSGDLRRPMLTHAVPYDAQRLYAHRYLRLIDEENLDLTSIVPDFPSEPPAKTPELTSPVLGIGPMSVAPARTWPLTRFADVAVDFLKQTNGTVILFGSPKEKPRVAQLADQITAGRVIDTSGALTLPELGWFMSRCDAYVGNDSGLMHVAAAFQIPSVIVFGPSEPKFALPPWGRFTTLQRTDLFCVPCLKNECVRFGQDRDLCMKTISPAEVTAHLQKLLSK